MTDYATYKRYADECRRLAAMSAEDQQRLLLEHAAAWGKLAEEAQRQAAAK